MGSMTMTESFDAPPQELFRVMTDLEGCPERIEDIIKVEVLTDGPVGVGTRWNETRKVMGREATEQMEIVAFEDGRSYTVRCESCGCESHWSFTFEPSSDGGTSLRFDSSFKALTFPAKIMSIVTAPMMRSMMKKCIEKDMGDIRRSLQQPAQ